MNRNKQFAVLGLGRFGQSIMSTLYENGYNVMACDENAELVHDAASYATYAVQVDLTDELAVEELGISNFDVVIIAISTDFEASLMATMIVKEKGAKYVLAKAGSLRQKKMLEAIGADRVVLPERETGIRIATNMITTNVIDFINLSDEYGIAEVEVLKPWIGKSLQQANIRVLYNLNVVAIKRNKTVMVTSKGEYIMQENDILVVIGEKKDIQHMSKSSMDGGAFSGVFD